MTGILTILAERLAVQNLRHLWTNKQGPIKRKTWSINGFGIIKNIINFLQDSSGAVLKLFTQNETSGEAKSTGQIIRAHRSMKIGMLVLFGMVSTITHKRNTSVPLKSHANNGLVRGRLNYTYSVHSQRTAVTTLSEHLAVQNLRHFKKMRSFINDCENKHGCRKRRDNYK